MISEEVQQALHVAKKGETHYWPSADVQETLAVKDFVMVVGPSAIGKSTLMNKVAELDPEFQRVHNTTTRPQRSNDEAGLYEYIPHTDEGVHSMLDMIARKELVQYAVYPTTGYIYATKQSSYPARYNMLDTQAQVVQSLSQLPFHKTHTVVLVTEPEVWQNWFNERNQKGTEEYDKRIGEAIQSLESVTSWQGTGIRWIYNRPTNIEQSARDLIEAIKGTKPTDPTLRDTALAMLSLAYDMQK